MTVIADPLFDGTEEPAAPAKPPKAKKASPLEAARAAEAKAEAELAEAVRCANEAREAYGQAIAERMRQEAPVEVADGNADPLTMRRQAQHIAAVNKALGKVTPSSQPRPRVRTVRPPLFRLPG